MLRDIISFGIFKSIRKIEVRLMQMELLKIQFVSQKKIIFLLPNLQSKRIVPQ